MSKCFKVFNRHTSKSKNTQNFLLSFPFFFLFAYLNLLPQTSTLPTLSFFSPLLLVSSPPLSSPSLPFLSPFFSLFLLLPFPSREREREMVVWPTVGREGGGRNEKEERKKKRKEEEKKKKKSKPSKYTNFFLQFLD